MFLFQLVMKKNEMAVYTVKCSLSSSATNEDLAKAFGEIGCGWMTGLVRVSEPEGKSKKYTRIYFKLDKPVHIAGTPEGKMSGETSFADRTGKGDIDNISISKIKTSDGQELVKLRVEYTQSGFPPGDPPDVMLTNRSTGKTSYGVEIGGKVKWKMENDFTLGIPAKKGK